MWHVWHTWVGCVQRWSACSDCRATLESSDVVVDAGEAVEDTAADHATWKGWNCQGPILQFLGSNPKMATTSVSMSWTMMMCRMPSNHFGWDYNVQHHQLGSVVSITSDVENVQISKLWGNNNKSNLKLTIFSYSHSYNFLSLQWTSCNQIYFSFKFPDTILSSYKVAILVAFKALIHLILYFFVLGK